MIKALTLVHGKTEVTHEELALACKVAFDTIPQDRLRILTIINENQNKQNSYGCVRDVITNSIKIPDSSVYKILQQLLRLELITEVKVEERGIQTSYYKVDSGVAKVLQYPLIFTKPFSESERVYTNEDTLNLTFNKQKQAEFKRLEQLNCASCGDKPCSVWSRTGTPLCNICAQNKAIMES